MILQNYFKTWLAGDIILQEERFPLQDFKMTSLHLPDRIVDSFGNFLSITTICEAFEMNKKNWRWIA